MKRFFKKVLYRDIPITEYTSITINNTISEKVFLKTDDTTIEVSDAHWALCLKPVIFGIWLNKPIHLSYAPGQSYLLLFVETAKKKQLAEIHVSFFDCIEEEEGTLLLVKTGKCKLFHIPFIETFFLYNFYYRKPGFSFNTFKSYVSAFSYPRKVRLVSFQDEGYYNIFPMDFVGKIGGTNRYVFGLRHTNRTLNDIVRKGKLVLSEIPFTYKEYIYKLGRHHSAAPPPPEQLPFTTSASKTFGFPVPSCAERYNEISITKTVNLGSHMLLWGESQYEEIGNTPQGNLYHIHFLLTLFLARKGKGYVPV